jgi:ribulose bisphosphate carboxylase small subunit
VVKMKVRTIHWEIEHELTYKELKSPEGTPSEWWQVPATRPYTSVDSAMRAVDKWQEQHPDRRVRLVEVETKRQAYVKTEHGAWRPE